MIRRRLGPYFLVAFILSGCGLAGSGPPTRDEALAAGAEACTPIIAALEDYHSAHGRFPDTLDDLVTSHLIDRIPDIPEIAESKFRGVTYEVSLPLDVYRLSFSYIVGDVLFRPAVTFSYMSDEGEWRGRKYPPSLWFETCERAASRYRERRDAATLNAFIASVTAEPDSSGLAESHVKSWFGEGEPKAIPRELSEGGRVGSCYGSVNGSSSICFTFRSREVRMHDGSTHDFPIVDTLYEIESIDGIEEWRILLAR